MVVRGDTQLAISRLARRMPLLLRYRYVVIALVAIASARHIALGPGHDDWPFFIWGARLLFGDHPTWAQLPGGLHLYANYGAQIGPVTLSVVAVLRWLFGNEGSRTASMILMTGLGPIVVRVLELAARGLDQPPRAGAVELERQLLVLVGGSAMTVAWIEIGVHWVHIDDGMALLAACCAMWAIARGRPAAVGVMVGIATASKPWAIVILPMVLAFGTSRERRRATVWAAVALLAGWLPFVLADRGTLGAGEVGVRTSAGSILHLFGVAVGATPSWVRPTQLVVGLALATMVVLKGRWPAVLLVGVSVRMLLDTAVWDYYSGGLVVAAFAWDILRKRAGLPWLTLVTFWAVFLAGIDVNGNRLPPVLRLAACVTAIVAAFAAPRAVTVSDDRH